MNIGTYSTIRLIALIMTLAIFVGHYFLPDKKLTLHPSESTLVELYGYEHPTEGGSQSWIDEKKHVWRCNYQSENLYGCGFTALWNNDRTSGYDLTAYNGMVVSLDYEGPASRLRMNMSNYNPKYEPTSDEFPANSMSMIIHVSDFIHNEVYINLHEFSVSEWWLIQKSSRREWSIPELDNVVSIGVDHLDYGDHVLRVKKIEFIGDWIKTKTLLFAMFGFWMAVFLLEGITRFYVLYQQYQSKNRMIQSLEEQKTHLEDEKENLKFLSTTDPLTGISNRAGVIDWVSLNFDKDIPNVGILLFDIDHFKNVNDTYGHDVGDSVLRAFSIIISNNLRSNDYFARWGGEEFVLITTHRTMDNLVFVANKLRKIVEDHCFDEDLDLSLTISIGCTNAKEGDSFESALKRSDQALYIAKEQGRNRVEYKS